MKKEKKLTYRCPIPPRNSRGFCIFHDSEYLEGKDLKGEEEVVRKKLDARRKRVRSKFMRLVKTSYWWKENTPLLFIGFHLPTVRLDLKFNSPVFFSHAEFHGEAYFAFAKFLKEAYFLNTVFHDRATFMGTEFHQNVYFTYAEFKREADFPWSQFHQQADFIGAKFIQSAARTVGHLRTCPRCNKPINCSKTSYENEEKKMLCHTKECSFWSSIFTKDGKINRINPDGFRKADFSASQFHHGAQFFGTEFVIPLEEHEKDCRSIKDLLPEYLKDKQNIIDERPDPREYVKFRFVTFYEPDKVVFDNTYLGRVSFINTPIDGVSFRNVLWRDRDERQITFDEETLMLKAEDHETESSGKIADIFAKAKKILKIGGRKAERSNEYAGSAEGVPFKDDVDVTLTNIVATYDQLRKNYESNLKDVEAGKFFISEMEVKRRVREHKGKPKGIPVSAPTTLPQDARVAVEALSRIEHLEEENEPTQERPGIGLYVLPEIRNWDGDPITFSITARSKGGWRGRVSLELENLPAGITHTFEAPAEIKSTFKSSTYTIKELAEAEDIIMKLKADQKSLLGKTPPREITLMMVGRGEEEKTGDVVESRKEVKITEPLVTGLYDECTKNGPFYRNLSILGIYRRLGLYGEDYITPILLILGVIFIFVDIRLSLFIYPPKNWKFPTVDSVLQTAWGIIFLAQQSLSFEGINRIVTQVDWNKVSGTYQYYFAKSVTAFFPFSTISEMTKTDLFERLLAVPLLGVLFLALRRRFERRFRH